MVHWSIMLRKAKLYFTKWLKTSIKVYFLAICVHALLTFWGGGQTGHFRPLGRAMALNAPPGSASVRSTPDPDTDADPGP